MSTALLMNSNEIFQSPAFHASQVGRYVMGVHGMSTQLLGNCRKTTSFSVAACVNSVHVSTQTLSCTEKVGELI